MNECEALRKMYSESLSAVNAYNRQLREENKQLRAESELHHRQTVAERHLKLAAESRLATAEGLLGQCVKELRHCHSGAPVIDRVVAFLASAQPAAPGQPHTRWCATTLASPRPCDCHPAAPAPVWDITTPEGAVEAYAEMSERQRELDESGADWHPDTLSPKQERHLAQPAAPARTEAAQAVLDAMGLIRKSELKRMAAERNDTVGAACEAELARREADK